MMQKIKMSNPNMFEEFCDFFIDVYDNLLREGNLFRNKINI